MLNAYTNDPSTLLVEHKSLNQNAIISIVLCYCTMVVGHSDRSWPLCEFIGILSSLVSISCDCVWQTDYVTLSTRQLASRCKEKQVEMVADRMTFITQDGIPIIIISERKSADSNLMR